MTESPFPLASVVIPVRNEAAFIERCLGAILNQDYPAERMEIIVADGMSDDATREIIRKMPGADRVTVIPNPGIVQAVGLNLAIQKATGEFIVRVDGHTVIAPDYVRRCVELLRETGAHNVGGPMDPVGITPMGKATAAAGKSPFGVPTAFHVSEQAQYTDTVYLGAWPRTVLEQVGLFDPTFVINQDYELNYRIRAAGGKIYFSPEIRSQYYGRQTLRALWRQYFRYGQGRVKTLRKHPRSLRIRHLVAPGFVAGLFGGLPLVTLIPLLAFPWLAGIFAYLALSLFFSMRAKRKAPDVALWRLPVVFATMHIAWGLGFWAAVTGIKRAP